MRLPWTLSCDDSLATHPEPDCTKAGSPLTATLLRIRNPRFAGLRLLQLGVLMAIAVLGFLWLGRDLPSSPWLDSDSQSYLQFSPVLPHGYPLFLAAYRCLFPDLAYLASFQLAAYIGAVLLLALAVERRTDSSLASAAVLLLTIAAADTAEFPSAVSDPLYAAASISGTAFLVFYGASRRGLWLFLATAGLGAALIVRAVGITLLLVLLLAVVAQRTYVQFRLVKTVAVCALPIVLLYSAAASSQLVHNGRFMLGNWGGMDVLGKVPLLSRLTPEISEFARLNGLIVEMQPARTKLARLNPLLEALTARQYYEYLRWYVMMPEFERNWPAWRDADDYDRGQLAARIALTYIAEDWAGFLRRTAIDLAGLWTMPRWLTESEYARANEAMARLGEFPFLTAFAQTEDGQKEFYKVILDPGDPAKTWVFRSIVISFWMLSLGLAGMLVSRYRDAVVGSAPDLIFIVLAVHAIYLTTALMEGVHERYIMPTWPLLVAGPILSVGLLSRAGRKA